MSPEARAVVTQAVARVASDNTLLPRLFASAGRQLRGMTSVVTDVWEWTDEDRFRVRLLQGCQVPWRALPDLYRYGDALERRAALRALDVLVPVDPEVTRALVDDALRSNDPRLVAAALGSAGVASLDENAFGQAVLKVAFLDLDVRRIPGVRNRMTPAIVHRLMGLVLERVAAGRAVPAGVWDITACFTDETALAALYEETQSAVPARREAARRALAGRAAAV
jgi:hypothetical protein